MGIKGGVNMLEKYKYQSSAAIMGTLTNAQKAQRALSAAAIPSKIVKQSSSGSYRGCVWSVEFSYSQKQNARIVLSNAGISVRAWSDEK